MRIPLIHSSLIDHLESPKKRLTKCMSVRVSAGAGTHLRKEPVLLHHCGTGLYARVPTVSGVRIRERLRLRHTGKLAHALASTCSFRLLALGPRSQQHVVGPLAPQVLLGARLIEA